MPALPPVPFGIRWEVHYKLGDDVNVVNVMHLLSGAGGALTQSQIDAVAAAAKSTWDTEAVNLQSHDVTMTQHVLTDLTTPTGVQSVLADTTVGGGSGAATGASLSLVVQMRAPLRGRSYRGRVFIAGISAANLADPQHWSALEVGLWHTAFVNMQTHMQAASVPCSFAIVSYYGPPTVYAGSISPGVPKRNHSTLRAVPSINGPATFVVDSRVGSQRRRNA